MTPDIFIVSVTDFILTIQPIKSYCGYTKSHVENKLRSVYGLSPPGHLPLHPGGDHLPGPAPGHAVAEPEILTNQSIAVLTNQRQADTWYHSGAWLTE